MSATIPHHQLAFGFAPTGGCGEDAAAGKNGNRTSFSDTLDGGTPTVTTYCYDNTDRLTSTTVANPQPGADPISGTNLTASTLVYDAHGNTTTLADQSLAYDQADRHTSTTLTDGSTVSYQRDATGRIIARTETPAGGNALTTKFGFTADGDTPDLILNGTGALIAQSIALPGGVTAQIPVTGAQVWSYPNLHGDVTVTTDGAGSRTGNLYLYDPFGNPIDPSTNRIGTTPADNSVPDTLPGSADNGWVGANQKLYEHLGDIATIEMGARQYLPALGRFLEVDPVAGGNANDYVYPSDPLTMFDLTGLWSWDDTLNVALIALTVVDFIPGLDLGSAALQGAIIGARAISAAADAAKFARTARVIEEGIYYIPKTRDFDGYVGQSSHISRRLAEQVRSGKITPAQARTAVRTEVRGGKTAREVAEQRKINSLGGARSTGGTLLNKVNPIGPNRQHLMLRKYF